MSEEDTQVLSADEIKKMMKEQAEEEAQKDDTEQD